MEKNKKATKLPNNIKFVFGAAGISYQQVEEKHGDVSRTCQGGLLAKAQQHLLFILVDLGSSPPTL